MRAAGRGGNRKGYEVVNIADALQYNPFEGEDENVQTLSDKIVTGRKEYPHCLICHGPIMRGEQHRALRQCNRDSQQVMTFRFCFKCCEAMVNHATGEGFDDYTDHLNIDICAATPLELRYEIGKGRMDAERVPQ